MNIMRNIITILLSISLLGSLNGCLSYVTTQPNCEPSKTELSTSPRDFSGIYGYNEKKQIAEAILDYLHQQHPSMADDFASLRVRSVKISNELAKTVRINDAQNMMLKML